MLLITIMNNISLSVYPSKNICVQKKNCIAQFFSIIQPVVQSWKDKKKFQVQVKVKIRISVKKFKCLPFTSSEAPRYYFESSFCEMYDGASSNEQTLGKFTQYAWWIPTQWMRTKTITILPASRRCLLLYQIYSSIQNLKSLAFACTFLWFFTTTFERTFW